jgi:hypothetical protein
MIIDVPFIWFSELTERAYVQLPCTFRRGREIAKGDIYVVGSKISWPDIQKPHQMENAAKDI